MHGGLRWRLKCCLPTLRSHLPQAPKPLGGCSKGCAAEQCRKPLPPAGQADARLAPVLLTITDFDNGLVPVWRAMRWTCSAVPGPLARWALVVDR